MEQDGARRGGALAGPEGVEPRRLLTLPRADGAELHVDMQRSATGAPFVMLRVWTPDAPEPDEYRPRMSLRANEIPAVVSALVAGLYAMFRHRGRHGRLTHRERAALARGGRNH